MVLGLIGRGECCAIWGWLVRDENGRHRARAIRDGAVAEVAPDFGGNTVASLCVGDDGEASLFLGD